MKNIFSKNLLIAIIISAVSILMIIVSTCFIKIDSQIQSLFPHDEAMERSLSLTANSSYSDKVIVYVETGKETELGNAVGEINQLIDKSGMKLKSGMIDQDRIKEVFSYIQSNSLLLYPYETEANPFTYAEMKKRISDKSDFMMSIPFFNPDESFFLDPLMMGTEILKKLNKSTNSKYSPVWGGIISANNKAYLKILDAGFHAEDYDKTRYLSELDRKINSFSRANNFTAFLYCAHLYYWESKQKITFDTTLIFILSTFLVLLVFFIFYRKVSLLIFAFMPLIGGFAVTFFVIALFKKQIGGIPLAVCSTCTGVAIDYTVNYLSRINLYKSVSEIRSKIGMSLFLGFVTTILAFVLLPLGNIKSLDEIALFGIITITSSYLLSYYLLQPLVKPGSVKCEMPAIKFPIPGKKAFFIWLAIMIALTLLLPFVRFEDNLLNLDMKHKVLDARLKKIQSNFKESSDRVFLAFTGKSRDKILEKSLNALNAIEEKSDDLFFITPALFTPPKNIIESRKNFIRENFSAYSFHDVLKYSNFTSDSFEGWTDQIENIDKIGLNPTGFLQEQIESMFVKWKGREYLLIPINTREMLNEIKTILREKNIDFIPIDVLKDSSKGLVKFEKNALLFLLLSIFIIFAILLFTYRNFRQAFSAILPALASLVACFAVTVLTFKNFNIMHLTASILLLGISVDYGIFITFAFRNRYSEDEVQATFQSLLICALTTLCGFGILIISRNYSVYSLGIGMLVGIVFAYLTTYLALPFVNNKNNDIENNQ